VFRGSHRGHFHIRRDTHRNHSLPHFRPQSDTRIEPLGDNVDEAAFIHQFQPDVRVTLFKNGELWQQTFIDSVLAGINTHRAGRRLTIVCQGRQTRIERIECRLGGLIKLFPGMGERELARGADQKLNAQSLFQLANRAADPGLRQPKPKRGRREAPPVPPA
jgi:hypothetical protein